MEVNDIQLSSIDKLFEYQKHSRVIDDLEESELKKFAKWYCKLYLKQQEVLSQLGSIDNI